MYRFLRRPRLRHVSLAPEGTSFFLVQSRAEISKHRPFCRIECHWNQDGIPARTVHFSRPRDTLGSFDGPSFCYRIVTTAASRRSRIYSDDARDLRKGHQGLLAVVMGQLPCDFVAIEEPE
jgi:hypothetical protein